MKRNFLRRCQVIRGNRRGVMLPLIAVLLPVLMVFVGFSVDLAYMQNTRLEMRVATDSAARAAATRLSATDSQAAALAEAHRVAGLNQVAGQPLKLDDSDVEFGHSQKNADDSWTFTVGGTPTNAVRVNSRRTGSSPSGSVPLYFGSFFGRSDFEPTETATASFLNIDICLVLDRSTSMKVDVDSEEEGLYTSDTRFCQPPGSNTKWLALDAAVRVFVSELRNTTATEHVALATYSSAYSPVVYCGTSSTAATLNSPLDGNLDVVETAVGTLSSTVWNGNTNIEAGMRVAIDELTGGNSRSNADKVMIVFTDGHQTTGSCSAAAQDAAAANITINTVTLGDYANRTAMQDVAAIGGGRHLHADDAASLAAAFRELAAQVAQLTE